MSCHQCNALDQIFDEKSARKELARYLKRGPKKSTRLLLDFLKKQAAHTQSLLDIGGGSGVIQFEMLEAGTAHAVGVDASSGYLKICGEEAQRRGLSDRLQGIHGNFTDIAVNVKPADVVSLDRVICCYDDMPALVHSSAALARNFYAVVYPVDSWWMKSIQALLNAAMKLLRYNFKMYIHHSSQVESIIEMHGFERVYYRLALPWQVAVYRKKKKG